VGGYQYTEHWMDKYTEHWMDKYKTEAVFAFATLAGSPESRTIPVTLFNKSLFHFILLYFMLF
jgi:ATP-dependent phosphoenolpyruvate carboxykinase